MNFKEKKLPFSPRCKLQKTLISTIESKVIATNRPQKFCSVRMLFHIETIRPVQSCLLDSGSHFSLSNTFVISHRRGRLDYYTHFI